MKLLVDFFPIILFFISYHQANFLVKNTFIGSLLDPTKSELITATIVPPVSPSSPVLHRSPTIG